MVDLLPLLCLHKSSGKVVLERSEVVKSCLRQMHCLTGNLTRRCDASDILSRKLFGLQDDLNLPHVFPWKRSTGWHTFVGSWTH